MCWVVWCVINWVGLSFQMIQTCHIIWQLISGIINEQDNTIIIHCLFWRFCSESSSLILTVLFRISLILMVLFRIKQSYFDCFVQNQAVLFCQFVPNQAVSFCQFCSKISSLILMVLFQIKESYSDILFRFKRSHFDCSVQILAVLLCRFVQNQAVLFCQFCS